MKPKMVSALVLALVIGSIFPTCSGAAEQNLLKNPGFEEAAPGPEKLFGWATTAGNVGKAKVADRGAHSGGAALAFVGADSRVLHQLDCG
jgi:hypothetical protein